MMKLGCLGCLGLTIVLLLILGAGGAGLWLWASIHGTPTLLPASAVRADPTAVHRRIAEIELRERGQSRRSDPLIFSEAEVAAWLARQLDDTGLRLTGVTVRLRTGRVTAQGKLPLGALIQDEPWAQLSSVLPRRSLETPVWITLRGTVGLDGASGPGRTRYAEVTLIESEVGRLSIPGWLLTSMLGRRGASLLRWPAPGIVERVEVTDGRLSIRTR